MWTVAGLLVLLITNLHDGSTGDAQCTAHTPWFCGPTDELVELPAADARDAPGRGDDCETLFGGKQRIRETLEFLRGGQLISLVQPADGEELSEHSFNAVLHFSMAMQALKDVESEIQSCGKGLFIRVLLW